MILLTRKAEFSSAHYYWNEAWTKEENERVFGRCANRNGHGHNYTLEVTVAGEVDAVSGFVVDLKELKEILEREVVSVYDHRHLNLEVAEFAAGTGVVPTTENIAIAIWRRLEGKIPGAKLQRVRVYEMNDLLRGALYGGRRASRDAAECGVEGLSVATIPGERVAPAALGGVQRGGEPCGLREVQQPAWARA
jgi:6-pyruvoyltetrahydropterin/6-carboxytetrahydropterin synthase